MKVKLFQKGYSVCKTAYQRGKDVVELVQGIRKSTKPEVLAQKRHDAQVFLQGISEETWNKMSSQIFAQPGQTESKYQAYLREVREILSSAGVQMPEDVAAAYAKLEHKSKMFAERMAVAQSKGKNPKNFYDIGVKFERNNQAEIEKVKDYIQRETENLINRRWGLLSDSEEYKTLGTAAHSLMDMKSPLGWHLTSDLYDTRIGELAQGVLQEGQTFYHGTTAQRAIAKEGFHLIPKKAQAAVGCRELGQGVYMTPDREVASYFAGLHGGILPLQVNAGKVAAVNNIQQNEMTRIMARHLGWSVADAAKMELVVSELFKRNGYNAAYTAESLGKEGLFGFNARLVDAVAGGKQSQLVVFNPQDITILEKTVQERLANQGLQMGTMLKMPYRVIQTVIAAKKAGA